VLDDEPMRYITKNTTWRFSVHIPRHNNNQFFATHKHNKETQRFVSNNEVSDDWVHHQSAKQQTSQKQTVNTN